MHRILSIDGGGVRGLVPALVLADLERRAQRPVSAMFDLVAGTSTGAILALALVHPDAAGRPSWSARELVDLYEDGGGIFERTPARCVRTVNGFLAPKYDGRPLTSLLRASFGGTLLRSALRDVLVPAYDTRRREPYFFATLGGASDRGAGRPMWQAARASAAAPTYFAPARLRDEQGERWLVDGGVFANNPALCAYAEVLEHTGSSDVLLVSLGTGELCIDFATRRMRRGGALLWARPLFDVMLDGQENVTDYQLRRLLPPERYFRFQPPLTSLSQRIDDARAENKAALRAAAERLIADRGAELDQVVAALTGAEHAPA